MKWPVLGGVEFQSTKEPKKGRHGTSSKNEDFKWEITSSSVKGGGHGMNNKLSILSFKGKGYYTFNAGTFE